MECLPTLFGYGFDDVLLQLAASNITIYWLDAGLSRRIGVVLSCTKYTPLDPYPEVESRQCYPYRYGCGREAFSFRGNVLWFYFYCDSY